MAITTPTLCGDGQLPIARSAPWAVNSTETSADAVIELKATPGAGFALYIKVITISGLNADALLYFLDSDSIVLFGPIQMQVNGGGLFTKKFRDPLKLTDNKALDLLAVDTQGAAFTVFVEGFTGQSPIV